MDLIGLTQNRERWWVVVCAVMKHSCSIKCGEFLDQLRNCWLLKKGLVPWSWYGSQNKQRLFPYTALTDWFV